MKMSRTILIETNDNRQMNGYLSLPSSGHGPGIVLLQEIFGVNEAMRSAADELARSGFVVLVPDIFHRIRPGIELGYCDTDREEAFGHMSDFVLGTGIEDVVSTVQCLRERSECNGKVALIGFCLGGKLAVMAAESAEVDSAVSFYGVKLQENLEELRELNCPLQIHVGTEDAHVPMEVVELLSTELSTKDAADIYIYEGAIHGFYNKVRGGSVYHAGASAIAEERVLSLLAATLN